MQIIVSDEQKAGAFHSKSQIFRCMKTDSFSRLKFDVFGTICRRDEMNLRKKESIVALREIAPKVLMSMTLTKHLRFSSCTTEPPGVEWL